METWIRKYKKSCGRTQSGFTLMEILVAVVMITILSMVVVANISDYPKKARITRAKSDIRTLEDAIKRFKIDNGFYPTTEQGIKALTAKPTEGRIPNSYPDKPYLDRLVKDPWKWDYQYICCPGDHGEFDVFSYGGDNVAGGEGEDADIGNFNLED